MLIRILRLMWSKGINITPNFVSMPRTKNCFLLIAMRVCVAQVANGLVGEKARKIVQFLFCILAFVVARMSHNRIWSMVWVLDNAKNQQEALER